MSKLLAALGLAVVLWLPQHAKATCTFNTSDGQMGRIRLPPVTNWDGVFDPNLPVGTIIKRFDFRDLSNALENPLAGSSSGSYTCSSNTGPIHRIGTTSATYQLVNSPLGQLKVYPTTVPGIGVNITWNYDWSLYGQWPFIWNPSPQSPGYAYGFSFALNISLVKTGPITQGGSLSGEVAGEFLPNHGNQQVASYLFSGEIPIRPTVPTCEPTVADQVVDLGRVEISSIEDDGYSNPVNFNVGLVCSGGVPATLTRQMAATFTDATDTTNTTDKLKLTSTSTGAGVKVQLLSGGTPVTFGPAPTNGLDLPNSLPLGTIQNGTYTYPFAARYVKTGTMAAGTANAIATFVFTYH